MFSRPPVPNLPHCPSLQILSLSPLIVDAEDSVAAAVSTRRMKLVTRTLGGGGGGVGRGRGRALAVRLCPAGALQQVAVRLEELEPVLDPRLPHLDVALLHLLHLLLLLAQLLVSLGPDLRVRDDLMVSIVSYRRPSFMIIASRTQFHVERPWGQCPFSIVS